VVAGGGQPVRRAGSDGFPDSRQDATISLTVGADRRGSVGVVAGGELDETALLLGLAQRLGPRAFEGHPSTAAIDDNDRGWPLLRLETPDVFDRGAQPAILIDTAARCRGMFASSSRRSHGRDGGALAASGLQARLAGNEWLAVAAGTKGELIPDHVARTVQTLLDDHHGLIGGGVDEGHGADLDVVAVPEVAVVLERVGLAALELGGEHRPGALVVTGLHQGVVGADERVGLFGGHQR
jgi:hypothetical protein